MFFFSSRRRHTRFKCDWSSDVCSSDLFRDILLGQCWDTRPHYLAGRMSIIMSNLQMSNLQRDIGSESLKISEVIERLRKDEFLIPTFKRYFVWQPENIRKLWDSIFRFYPMGSLL